MSSVKHRTVFVLHPPNSLELVLCNFSLFLKLKIHLNSKIGAHWKKYNGAALHYIRKGISGVFWPIKNSLEFVCWTLIGLFWGKLTFHSLFISVKIIFENIS